MKATADRLDTFRRWGLTTLGDIAALPAADLSERMGQDGLVLQRLAQGVDLAPLVPDPGVPRFLQSIELEWPIDALEPLSFVLARLLDPLSAALERADRGAAALRLDLRLVDRTMHARVLQLPAAMRDAKVLRTLLLLDLESHPPPAGIDIVTVEIDPAPARIIQYSLLERAMPSAETLATLTARLGALVGESRCGSAALLDTYRPDGFEMRRFLAEAQSAKAGSRTRQFPSSPPRDGVILRRFRMPIAIRVTVERARPVRVAIDRRGMPGGHVEQQAGPWRTSGAWWDPAGAAWDRDEWDVALSDGSLCRLFRDRLTEKWFLEGVLD
jgi:protein ImuB